MDRGRLTTYSEKLAMCLRLLGSDQDGEVVAAVRALKRMLRSSGEDFHDLAARVEKPALNDARCGRFLMLASRPESVEPKPRSTVVANSVLSTVSHHGRASLFGCNITTISTIE